MADDYEREQDELEKSMEHLQAAINDYEEQSINIDKFLELVDRYTDFKELTTAMLNEFIEKVVIHERIKGYRYTTTQKIDIFFNFVGMVELPEMKNGTVPESGWQPKYISAKLLLRNDERNIITSSIIEKEIREYQSKSK